MEFNFTIEVDDTALVWEWVLQNISKNHLPHYYVTYRLSDIKSKMMFQFKSEATESATLLKLFWG